jgi:pseudouridine synthase
MKERLQKILARAGHGSRRSAEALIVGGRVRVNGEAVTQLGAQADADTDRIEVDGAPIVLSSEQVYIVMNKPRGFVTTASDPQGRRTVMELLPQTLPPHVIPVGRLDRDSEGLLIFTNDGEMAHRLAHPRYQIDKQYYALVQGRPSAAALETLRRGVEIEGQLTAAAQAELGAAPAGYDSPPGYTWLHIVIHEGRKRQVRLMCAAVGHGVRTLVRTRIGDITLGRLAKGKTRPLDDAEVAGLRAAVGLGR